MYCPKCGTKAKPYNQFCESCGQSLSAEASSEAKPAFALRKASSPPDGQKVSPQKRMVPREVKEPSPKQAVPPSARISSTQDEPRQKTRPKAKRKRKRVLAVILCVVMATALFVGGFLLALHPDIWSTSSFDEFIAAIFGMQTLDAKNAASPIANANLEAWEAFIGDNNGKTGVVFAAPEVDEAGNYITSEVVVKKPETNDDPMPYRATPPVSDNAPPQEYLEKWLDGFKTSNWTQVKLLSAGFDGFADQDGEGGVTRHVFEKLTWSIVQNTIESEKVTYTVEISVPYIKDELLEYINTSQIDPDDTNTMKNINNAVKDIVQRAQMQRTFVDATLIKDGAQWKVLVTDEILTTMTGGVSDAYRELLQDYLREVNQ